MLTTALHPSWWDEHSDQPHRLSAEDKKHRSPANAMDYVKTGGTALALLPRILNHYRTLPPLRNSADINDFIGLGISPDRGSTQQIIDLVQDLGVQQIQLRVPTWHADQLDDYLELAQALAGRNLLVTILQSRQSVADISAWSDAVSHIVETFLPLTQEFQIGNAINRSKWGCHNTTDYLRLLETLPDLKARYPEIVLAGSSVIDFEPLATLRTLFNGHQFDLDACCALLYVNRRGSPFSKQYGLFDLRRKLRLIATLASLSKRCASRLWITETNWPLLDTKPYTPNSGHPRSTVDEKTQAEYLSDYYRIAWQSGCVERVYWWQLINPGYGLVDHRGGQMRKMPSFFALQKLVHSANLS